MPTPRNIYCVTTSPSLLFFIQAQNQHSALVCKTDSYGHKLNKHHELWSRAVYDLVIRSKYYFTINALSTVNLICHDDSCPSTRPGARLGVTALLITFATDEVFGTIELLTSNTSYRGCSMRLNVSSRKPHHRYVMCSRPTPNFIEIPCIALK